VQQVFEQQEINQDNNMKCGRINDSVLEACCLVSRNSINHLKSKCVEVEGATG
jgi:hypothetical protein